MGQLFTFYTLVNGWPHIYLSLVQSACSVPSFALFYYQLRRCSLSLEHKNDHDGFNPRNKATGYLELCSPIIIIIVVLRYHFDFACTNSKSITSPRAQTILIISYPLYSSTPFLFQLFKFSNPLSQEHSLKFTFTSINKIRGYIFTHLVNFRKFSCPISFATLQG